VLLATASSTTEAQQKICGMSLRIICEAWLDHIYQLKVQFRWVEKRFLGLEY
jgi:hypothetical protein